MRPQLYCDVDSTLNDHWRRIWRHSRNGVIQPSAYEESEVMLDQPLPGAVAAMNEFSRDWDVHILSSRWWDPHGEITRRWLKANGFPEFASVTILPTMEEKPVFLSTRHVDLFIDDFSYGQELDPEPPYPVKQHIIDALNCPHEVFNTQDPDEWRRIVERWFGLIPNGEVFWQFARRNLEWWRVNRDHERSSRARYYDNFAAAVGLTPQTLHGKTVCEIGAGPFGGLIRHLDDGHIRYAVLIDPLATAQKALKFEAWPHYYSFRDCPAEKVCLPNKSVDVLLSFNALDLGWSVHAALNEIARVSKECFIAFDCKADTAPAHDRVDHYQIVRYEECVKQVRLLEHWCAAKVIAMGDLRQVSPPHFEFEHNWGFPVFFLHAVFP